MTNFIKHEELCLKTRVFAFQNDDICSYFHAEAESGDFFSFPWIVAPAALEPGKERKAKVALMMSNMNWNAYNNFGGRSNYIHPDRLPDTPTMNARMELNRYTDAGFSNYNTEEYAPLSMDRPVRFYGSINEESSMENSDSSAENEDTSLDK